MMLSGNKTSSLEKGAVAFWSVPEAELFANLRTSANGLTEAEAASHRQQFGVNALGGKRKISPWRLFLRQFKSPIILLLLFATVISLVLEDYVDAVIIFIIIFISSILGFFQEYHAGLAVDKLLDLVRITIKVKRDCRVSEVPSEALVPGDIMFLSAGDVIAADARLLSEQDLRIDESSLTGESMAVEKNVGQLNEQTPLAKRENALWMGTHVVSGDGTALVVRTGLQTEFGSLARHMRTDEQESGFEISVRKFGALLMEITLFMLVSILGLNLVLGKPAFESFVFALALAVGMTPQLLPAIISINLSHGAREMAKKHVIVKKLAAIEDFGSMDVLCSDKTGTITAGNIALERAADITGQKNEEILELAYLNASLQTAFANPIDAAIRDAVQLDLSGYKKLEEIPYNFTDKMLSVILETPANSPYGGKRICVTKGAVQQMLPVCTEVRDTDGSIHPINDYLDSLNTVFQNLSEDGLRTLGLAYKPVDIGDPKKTMTRNMIFAGFVCVLDPLKEGVEEAIDTLRELGIALKVITGDNRYIAAHIARQLNLDTKRILTGSEILDLTDAALLRRIQEVELFAEIEPNQKERIVLAFKKLGHVVGFMGDGINDSPAIHAADVGISVNTAADVAKDAAKIVLLEKDLHVLASGVKAGRITFANTLKYIYMATSANFGNMFSMAGASLVLPFLPLRSTQILLTNLLTDFPEMQIASDNMEEALIKKPQRWDMSHIKRFMICFGALSSVFDFLTFGVIMFIFHAKESMFHTAWLTESVISACLVVFVVRTRMPCFKSKPGRNLIVASVAVVAFVLTLPYLGIGGLLGLVPLPLPLLGSILLIVLAYLTLAEVLKRWFYTRWP